jgi:hypothetical protein
MQNNCKMKRKPVDKQHLKLWKRLMFDTTQEAIREKTGLSRPTIADALNGKATHKTIVKLDNYFKEFKAAQ